MTGFFDAHPQRDLALRQYRAKEPLFYRRASFTGAVFAADFDAVRARLPTALHRPLRLGPGRAVAAIHCLEYADSDIGPYNEVSLSAGIVYGHSPIPSPIHALRAALSLEYHAFVLDLPVTTDVALVGGIDVFGYPKYLADISFRERDGRRTCTLRDVESGALILEFETRLRAVSDRPRMLTLHSYPRRDGTTLHARLLMRLLRHSIRPGGAVALHMGPHPRADAFRALRLGRVLQSFHVPSAEGILFLPEPAHAGRA